MTLDCRSLGARLAHRSGRCTRSRFRFGEVRSASRAGGAPPCRDPAPTERGGPRPSLQHVARSKPGTALRVISPHIGPATGTRFAGHALKPAAWPWRAGYAWITHDATGHEPIPDEQYDQRADRGADQASALIKPIPPDRLTDERGDEGACDPEQRRENEARWIVRTWREHARDNSGDEPDDDDPYDVRHDFLPFPDSGPAQASDRLYANAIGGRAFASIGPVAKKTSS